MADLKTVVILETTDGKFVGTHVTTDLLTLMLPTNESIDIDGRMHLGNGVWKLWNSNYIILVQDDISDKEV